MPLRDIPHEKLPHRLTQILDRLNHGQTLAPRALADEFKVSLRTMQRDLVQRFAFLGLERVEGGYRKDDGEKLYTGIAPYKLISFIGIWHLTALDGDQLKVVTFTKLGALLITGPTVVREPRIEQLLKDEDSIWLNEKKTKVVLKVVKDAVGYFRRRKPIRGRYWKRNQTTAGSSSQGRLHTRIKSCQSCGTGFRMCRLSVRRGGRWI